MHRLSISIVIMPLLLSGCITANSEPVAANAQPSLFTYSPAMQKQAADELEGLPDNSALRQFVTDYGVVRCQIKVAKKFVDPETCRETKS